MRNLRALAISGWTVAALAALLGFWAALNELAHGWREVPQHWWSTLAAMIVLVAITGLVLAVSAKPGER